jgi:hypothetical protein|tara:strand:- start:373 stop:888 length:516 start_codon:yes stop_codon:yes gene_type:complete
MGNINDNIRSKKLYKSGEVDEAYKDSNGDIVVPTKVAAELDAIDGITEIINDSGVFHVNKHLVKEIENMRLDIEELHGFIKAAFGKDYTQASSKGDTGDRGLRGYTGSTGSQGVQGVAGSNGSNGSDGAAGSNGKDGNSHLSNVTSIGINRKSGQLEIVIGRSTYKFNTDK